MLKSELRKELKEKLTNQNVTQRLEKSRLIQEKLFNLAEFKRAEHLMFYLAMAEEVQTRAMISAAQKLGKQILVPVIFKEEKRMIASLIKDLNKEVGLHTFGFDQPQPQFIREMPPERIDLILVPGLAFDQQGRRLGRGGGYYDRFLANLPAHTPRIGLAFDFQILTSLPFLPHDISVTKVISA